jgi:hypothetical protein
MINHFEERNPAWINGQTVLEYYGLGNGLSKWNCLGAQVGCARPQGHGRSIGWLVFMGGSYSRAALRGSRSCCSSGGRLAGQPALAAGQTPPRRAARSTAPQGKRDNVALHQPQTCFFVFFFICAYVTLSVKKYQTR